MIEGDWNRENALSPEGRYKAYPVGIKSIFLKNNVQILIRILLTSSKNTSQKKIVNENRPNLLQIIYYDNIDVFFDTNTMLNHPYNIGLKKYRSYIGKKISYF